MKVKTLTGPSIQAALAEARHLLGDEVVLLEAVPAENGQPARITVMSDTPVLQPSVESLRSSILAVSPTLRHAREAVAEEAVEVGAAPVLNRTREEAAVTYEGVSVARGGYASAFPARGRRRSEPGSTPPVHRTALSAPASGMDMRRRDSLFTDARSDADAEPRSAAAASLAARMETQLKQLNDRLQQLESTFGETVIGASMQWAAHPLFAMLLKKGMRPATAARLFDRMAGKGYTPDAEHERLHWALAQELRNALDLEAPRYETGTLLLLGPSGAGKTSLALKLAKHQNFYGRRRTTVIFIQPEDEQLIGYHTPVAFYRQHGIPVQSVRTAEEMQQALGRVQQFDQIIIDSSPMPSQEQEGRRMLGHVRRVADVVMPLQIQLVVNATRVLDGLGAAFLKNMPLRPDSVAITHLDEVDDWGRIAEWMMAASLPVRTVSMGQRVPDGLASFSPSWFVEKMMQR
ncbi:MAG TPA: flagellar biosynthesis protein FlhF [Rhodothermales bacterium]|nr:flagellar biosynthesis protein FlhF [Rhodothermales bacterium]